MFLMDTSMCIIDVNNAIREMTDTLTSNSSLSLADRYALTASFPWPVESALYAFMVSPHHCSLSARYYLLIFVLKSNLGDIIIIWRVYVFYSDPSERWVLAFPITLLVGSFGESQRRTLGRACDEHHFLQSLRV